MAIAEVTVWLNGKREYAHGVTLFNNISNNAFLKKVFSLGDNASNRAKLLQELTTLNKTPDAKPVVIRKEIVTDAEFKDAPQLVREKIAKAKELIKLNAKRHAEIYTHIKEARKKSSPPAPQRGVLSTKHPKYNVDVINAYLKERNVGDLANMILDTDDEIADLFAEIDYWRAHKELPAAVAVAVSLDGVDPVAVKQLLLNVRSNVSKYKGFVKRHPDDEHYKRKLAELEGKRDELERTLEAVA